MTWAFRTVTGDDPKRNRIVIQRREPSPAILLEIEAPQLGRLQGTQSDEARTAIREALSDLVAAVETELGQRG